MNNIQSIIFIQVSIGIDSQLIIILRFFNTLLMSRYISKLFLPEKVVEQPKPAVRRVTQYDNKKLPPDFAEQILVHDIILEISEYTSKDSLHALVQLYMKGVEYYESLQDERQIYFKKKLQFLMSHPKILQQSQEQTKQVMKIQKQEVKQPFKLPQRQRTSDADQFSNFQSHMPTIQSVIKEDESVCQFNEDDQQYEKQKEIFYEKEGVYHEQKQKGIFYENEGVYHDKEEVFEREVIHEKEKIVLQTMKQEIYLQDDKRQAKQMMAGLRRESQQINQIIQEDIETQAQKITNRLRQRSSKRFNMNRASSQPVFQRFGFRGGTEVTQGQAMETMGNQSILDVSNPIKEDCFESSQVVSRRPSHIHLEDIIDQDY